MATVVTLVPQVPRDWLSSAVVDCAGRRFYMTGRRVSVQYNGDADEVYLGYETCINTDGTFSIRYDDGEEQSGVDPRWVTYVSHVNPASMRVGLRIEVGLLQPHVPRPTPLCVNFLLFAVGSSA